jgi:type I restriction enzyme, S subunit
MKWKMIKLKAVLKQYRIEHWVQDNRTYKQVTISKYGGVTYRGEKNGRQIGRKRQFVIDLKKYPNTLLFIRQGVQDGGIGIAPLEVDGCIVTENMPMFSIENIEVAYLNYILKSPIFKNQLNNLVPTGSAQKAIHERQLLEIEIPLPDSADQMIITDRLSKIEDLFRELFEEITLQQSYLGFCHQSILQEAVQGKLTKQNAKEEPADELLKRITTEKEKFIKRGELKKEKGLPPIDVNEIPFELPAGWQWCRLNDIVDVKSGVTLGKIYKEQLHEVPYLRVANVQRGYIDLDHLKTIKVPMSEIKKYKLEKGDLCMVEGGDWDKVGRCAIWEHDTNPCIHQNHIFRLRFYGGIVKEWCEMYLNSPIARRYFENFSKQTTNLASINKTQLRSLLFALPPIDEQKRIVIKVKELQNHLRLLEAQVTQSYEYAEQLFQAVLKEAFSSKTNVIPFERKVLAGHIINMLHQDRYFGLVKFQKTLHVCEHHAQVKYKTNYEQEVAGPYDREFTLTFKKEMVEQDWFQQEMRVSLNRFVPGNNVGKLEKEFPKYFRDKGKEIRFVLQLFQEKTLAESELIATLYAVWNNRLIRKEPIDISYLIEDVYKWSERKAIYSVGEITAIHSWMIEKGLVPTGFGKEITRASN